MVAEEMMVVLHLLGVEALVGCLLVLGSVLAVIRGIIWLLSYFAYIASYVIDCFWGYA